MKSKPSRADINAAKKLIQSKKLSKEAMKIATNEIKQARRKKLKAAALKSWASLKSLKANGAAGTSAKRSFRRK